MTTETVDEIDATPARPNAWEMFSTLVTPPRRRVDLECTGVGGATSPAAYAEVAADLGCDDGELMALVRTISGGRAFDRQSRVLSRYDGHAFHRKTGGRFAEHRSVAWTDASWTHSGLLPDDLSYDQLERAVHLDEDAAWTSTRWGVGLIPGLMCELAGYSNPKAMVDAFKRDPDEQLRAFGRYVEAIGVATHLRAGNADELARRFVGPDYAMSTWPSRFRRHYRRITGALPRVVLQIGDHTCAVRRLQQLLAHEGHALTEHGYFDAETQKAVLRFQEASGLSPDGIVGARTWTALRAERAGVLLQSKSVTVRITEVAQMGSALGFVAMLALMLVQEVSVRWGGVLYWAVSLVPPIVIYGYFLASLVLLVWSARRLRS